MSFKDRGITILDGGFSSQLNRYVSEPMDGHVLWTSRFLFTDKEAVIKTHLDYIKAGADVITTNTYQANIDNFMKHFHLTEEEGFNLIKESAYLARIAISRFKKEFPDSANPLIAGSVGPYGAALQDGSEYSGKYAAISSTTIKTWHTPRIKALVEAGVDLIAFETIPCKSEAIILVNLLKDFPSVKAWLSFSCKDGTSISNGDNFQEAVQHCYDLNPQQLVAVGANCISPKFVEPLFKNINKGRDSNKIPLLVYPNSGEMYSTDGWKGKEECIPLAQYVNKWIELGITWIGGCCRTTAKDIAEMKQNILKTKPCKSK